VEKIISVCASQLGRVFNAAMGELDYIKSQVEQGNFEFFRIDECFFVTTAEDTHQGRELVIVCAEGQGLAQASKILQQRAKAAGFATVRIHAFRRGMRRLLKQFDFKEAETVYRLQL